MGSILSTMANVNFGVPQGSILGPHLFTLYINSFPSVVSHCKINLYADDTADFFAGKTAEDISSKLNKDLGNIATWMEEN